MTNPLNPEEDGGAWWEWLQSTQYNVQYEPSPIIDAMGHAIRQGSHLQHLDSSCSVNTRDVRDVRDSLSANGRAVSERVNKLGAAGTKAENGAHFKLVEQSEKHKAGVYWVGVNKEGNFETPRWICSPMQVAAQTRDMHGGEWGRLLIFPDRDGRDHQWAMPMRMLAAGGEELRAQLLAEGLTITNGRDRGRLADYIQNAITESNARSVSRTGWHDDVFVLPRETFGEKEGERILFQSASMDGVHLGQGGTLDDWREHVSKPCASHSRLALALCAGFAGPCLALLGMDGGGFHLRGPSSIGKSTALAVAASIYGPPAFLRTWRNTDNALEGVAALHSDMLLILDELSQLDPKHAGQVAYLLANGQGKGRAARDGSPRAVLTWRVLFLSAGEIGLTDLVTQSGGKVRAGQQVRVIDLPADAGVGYGMFEVLAEGVAPGAMADALKNASAKNYGHAMPALVRILVEDPAKARAELGEMRSNIATDLIGINKAGQVRRVADRFAIVAAAGEFATEHSLTGWRQGDATRAIKACFAAWMDARGTDGEAEPAAMLEQVRAFLLTHSESRFTAWDSDDRGTRTANRAGFRRDTDGDFNSGPAGPTYYIHRDAFRREVCAGFDHKAVAKVLADLGALKLESDGGSTRSERLPDAVKNIATPSPQENLTCDLAKLEKVFTQLYPSGPQHNELWSRSGGDVAVLLPGVSGRAAWHSAIRTIALGGGGTALSFNSLIETGMVDFPKSEDLKGLQR